MIKYILPALGLALVSFVLAKSLKRTLHIKMSAEKLSYLIAVILGLGYFLFRYRF